MSHFKLFIILSTLFFSGGTFARLYSGELEVLVFDDFQNKAATILYRLHEGNNIYVLNIPQEFDKDKNKWKTGAKVVIDGQEVITKNGERQYTEKTILVKSIKIQSY